MARTKTSKRKTPATNKVATLAEKKQIPVNIHRPMESASDIGDVEAEDTPSQQLSTPRVSLEDISTAKGTPKLRKPSTPTATWDRQTNQMILRLWTPLRVPGNLSMLLLALKKHRQTKGGSDANHTPSQMSKNQIFPNGTSFTLSSMLKPRNTTRIPPKRMASSTRRESP